MSRLRPLGPSDRRLTIIRRSDRWHQLVYIVEGKAEPELIEASAIRFRLAREAWQYAFKNGLGVARIQQNYKKKGKPSE